jgi:hypothetical protein
MAGGCIFGAMCAKAASERKRLMRKGNNFFA